MVQAFEFTHELAWNVMKDFLEESGQSGLYGSKDATRAALASGLIQNGDLWMRMIVNRNQTTHTYNQETVDDICAAIVDDYSAAFANFRKTMAGLKK